MVFDVEGVLIPRNRFLFEVGRSLGALPLLKILFFGFLYETGLLPLKKALKHLFMVARGAKLHLLLTTLEKLPLMPDTKQVFTALKSQGCKTALISSGLPTVLVEKIAVSLGADYAVGAEIGVENGALTGEIWGDVTERNGKMLALKKILRAEGLNLGDCAAVADDRNNACIFQREMRRIGYNPDFVMRVKADTVVTGRLTKILPALDGKRKPRILPTGNDFFRETIHASGFLVPVIAALVGVPLVALMISAVVAVYAASEFLRARGINMPLISDVTRCAASQSELSEFALAPIYFALGILLTLLLLPFPANSAAIAIFALGDSAASLVGGAFSGKPLPLNKAKTLEGSLAGLLFAFLAGSVFVAPWVALVGAAVAMLVESLPLPLNDNISIPLCTGLVLTLLA